LQDWTQCTLKCGGGKSYQHWLCIPPKNGGRPCTGNAIKVRPCNSQKCPGVGDILKFVSSNQKQDDDDAEKRPFVKMAPFSNRPQRYSKCVVKESDAFLTSKNPETKELQRQPVRIVMNNQTVSVYSDDDYENKMYTYNLETTSLLRKGYCCIKIRDTYKSLKFCGFTLECGIPQLNKWTEDWLKEFKLFKTDCRTKRQHSFIHELLLKNNKTKNLNEILSESDMEISSYTQSAGGMAFGHQGGGNMPGKGGRSQDKKMERATVEFERLKEEFQKDVRNSLIGAKQKILKKKFKEQQRKAANKRVNQMKNLEGQVLKKEIDIEHLITKEERKREKRKLKKMKKMIKCEKKKAAKYGKANKRKRNGLSNIAREEGSRK